VTLEQLKIDLGNIVRSAEYDRKQLHAIPDAKVVIRNDLIISRCRDKTVLDIGASGQLHEEIVAVAKKCYGLDKNPSEGVAAIDLDDYHAQIPRYNDVEVVVAGEVVEHLSNPGWFLKRLREAYRCQTIITVPNAFTDVGRKHLNNNRENVNDDHVAWYSHKTIKTLLERHGYAIKELYWYGGRPIFAEGLIVVTE
jgi:2-polyprenyl-3-methyl-5-hydroxy-6-metoxy-1,4-benzoquinol methylase